VDLPPKIAAKLAIYAGDQLAVLAPRGWLCVGVDHVGAVSLRVYPKAGSDEGETLISIGGVNDGGILQLASFGGRYFPAFEPPDGIRRFLSSDDAGDLRRMPLNKFLVPKFKNDILHYMDKYAFSFTTPAHVRGIGDLELFSAFPYSVYPASALPTYGFAAIDGNPQTQDVIGIAIYFLILRVPKNLAYLRFPIENFLYICLSKNPDGCSVRAMYPPN